jgi:uncharacterized membrane protein YgdD (TMEM256/DUF423 family)
MIGALGGMLSVILGAFGAHGLEGALPERHLIWWQKGVAYQGFHSLAILVTGLFLLQRPATGLKLAGWLFLAGILLFSGSLYLMALSGYRSLGMVTPLGGLAFIGGWCCLAWAAWRLPD